MNYNHTQRGDLILYVLVVLILFFGFILAQTGVYFPTLIFMVIIFLILISFSYLNVTIDKNFIRIKFGYGLFRKNFDLKNIVSAKSVKNHWYYGWGIRFWMFPPTWVYNVSGFDAVEIKMKNGKLVRIGTDEPKKLEKAILQSIDYRL